RRSVIRVATSAERLRMRSTSRTPGSATRVANGLTISTMRIRGSGGRRVPAHAVEEQIEEPVRERVRGASGLEPRGRPVRGREEHQRRSARVEIRPELTLLDALAEERSNALLVTFALRDELELSFLAEVAPFAHEHRRHVELLGDDAQVSPQRAPELL